MLPEQPLAGDRRKALRVRALTDPLGAKGLRRTRPRIVRETRARRTIFAVVIAAFVACFGFIAGSRGGASPAAANSVGQSQPQTALVTQGGQFESGRHHRHFTQDNGDAAFPGFGQTSGDSAPNQDQAPTSHVRTKTS